MTAALSPNPAHHRNVSADPPPLPLQLPAGHGPEELYQAVNIVKVPSMIRVEADELTYVMHIVIRWVPGAQNRTEYWLQ